MTCVVVVGGTDSSGGAGLTRDAATAARLGCRVKPVVTAITVQTDAKLYGVTPVTPEDLHAQMRAALEAPTPAAIKIGLVATAAQVACLAAVLPPDLPIVFDPVLRSSSGGMLATQGDLRALLRRVTLLTPNMPESAAFSGQDLAISEEQRASQAKALRALGPEAVLLKGGHASGAEDRDESVDYLYSPAGVTRLSAPRLAGTRRGTGCSLATAIACALAQGAELTDACRSGKSALTRWWQEQDRMPAG